MARAIKRRRIVRRRRAPKLSITRAVRTVINKNLEQKFFEFSMTGIATSTQWAFFSPIPNIVQGTTANNRIGNKIRLKKIQWNIKVVPNVVAATGAMCKMILAHDKQCNGTNPTAALMFTGDNIMESKNPIYAKRFSITKTGMHNMVALSNNGGAVSTTGPMSIFTWNQYCNKTIEFVDNVVNISAIMKDNYFFAWCGTANTCCNVTIDGLMYFTDE